MWPRSPAAAAASGGLLLSTTNASLRCNEKAAFLNATPLPVLLARRHAHSPGGRGERQAMDGVLLVLELNRQSKQEIDLLDLRSTY